MKVRATGKTHIGMKRKLNEDCLLMGMEVGLYVIADGMGGHTAGEVASRMVIETMADYWRRVRNNEPPTLLEDSGEDIPEEAKHLVNSISMCNIMIHEAQKRPEYHRMGSTVSAVLVEGEYMWSANVGDSPIYLFDQRRLIRISEEHSVEAERKILGISDPLTTSNLSLKNILTRVLGLNPDVKVFINPIRPEAGDVIMICSDGLTNFVSEKIILQVISDSSLGADQKVGRLIEHANLGGGGDNISVILLEVLEEGKWDRFKKKFVAKD